jgi:hypothetical protein
LLEHLCGVVRRNDHGQFRLVKHGPQ